MELQHFVQLIALGLQAPGPMHMTGFPGLGKTEFTRSLEVGFDRVVIKFQGGGPGRVDSRTTGLPRPSGVEAGRRLPPMAWAQDAQRLAEEATWW